MNQIRRRRKEVASAKTLGECSGGEIVRLADGLFVVSGPLAGGTFIRPWPKGEPTVANDNTPVIETIDRQSRYGVSGSEEVDPLKRGT